MNRTTKKLTLENDIEQITKLVDFIDSLVEEGGIDMALAMSINLALEEAVTNVILYAYPEGEKGTVDIEASVSDDTLTFVISDKGVPFNPTEHAEANITLGVEERPIGGLGIFLVRQLMDSVAYARTDGCNILTLTKHLLPTPNTLI